MLSELAERGAADARRILLKTSTELPTMPGGWAQRAGDFARGQVGAAKDLFANLRGGLGGKMNPGMITGEVPPQSMGMARASMRQGALGNLRTLAPSLLAGGGLYMLHRHHQAQQEAQRQQQMMNGGMY